MGARVITRADPSAQKRREARALAGIIACIAIPLALGCFLAGVDMRVDLSELTPDSSAADAPENLIGWPELDSVYRRNEFTPSAKPGVRLMGYMMDDPDIPPAQEVSRFTLMPEAGQLIHPAHREPGHMIEVHLTRPAAFLFRKLVWVTGDLQNRKVRPNAGKAAWVMEAAVVSDASSADTPRYFGPQRTTLPAQ